MRRLIPIAAAVVMSGLRCPLAVETESIAEFIEGRERPGERIVPVYLEQVCRRPDYAANAPGTRSSSLLSVIESVKEPRRSERSYLQRHGAAAQT